ncbi:hypothetical protein [Vibrio scophthalmi]|uniref:Fimbrial protein n=1 Tax=Vibrio scophthalmi TaxID=45658 RepID=A0A1E3WJ56_9VIBR|nr:hypothetical protein [Vibrio scophthalmi]ODS05582.1 hypothetical protein VSF3289_04723 [Vibrio scophthalmi]
MKKTILAVTLLFALSLSGAANAFTESVDGNFSGSINFSGAIVDSTPIWRWEVPGEAALTGWDMKETDGVVSGSFGEHTTFTFASKPTMTLIHGFMKTPAVSGGVGLTPRITLNEGVSTVILEGDTKSTVRLVATGRDAKNAAVADGTMEIKAQAFLGGVLIDASTVKYFGSTKAQTLLSSNQADFATTYPSPVAATNNFSEARALFGNRAMSDLSGAYVVEVSDYKLTFPTVSLPATWEVIIPVTVRVF